MPLGTINNTEQNKTFLSINGGQINTTKNGRTEAFSYVEGQLSTIYKKEREYNGERVLKWFIEMEDSTGENYVLSFGYNSGTFKSIVLSLASVPDIRPTSTIKIQPYEKRTASNRIVTNVNVYKDGQRLNWIVNDLPPIKELQVGGQVIKDTKERMDFVESMVGVVLKNLHRTEH